MSKKVLSGKVVKNKNDKTVVVLVKRRYIHPFFKKVLTSSKKYHAHDEKNKFKIGDQDRIQKWKNGRLLTNNDTGTNRINGCR